MKFWIRKASGPVEIAPVPVIRVPSYVGFDSLLIFLIGLAIFSILPPPEFTHSDARYALFAQEMLRDGPGLFPTTYGSPYPDYPATSTLMIYGVSRLFGQVTPLSAILPTAIISALILVVTYRIGAIQSRKWGLAAVLFELFTVEFLTLARSISLDQCTSLATALSFYLAYSSDCLGRKKRLWFLPVLWLLSFAVRGPIGLVIPVATTCAYDLWNLRFKRALQTAALAGGMMILCIGALLLAAWIQGGMPFLHKVLAMQMMGRLAESGNGFAYYSYMSFTFYAVAYPVAILVVMSKWWDLIRRKNEQDNLLGALSLWVVVVILGMSIPSGKAMRYIISVVPALSLIAAGMMIDASPRPLLLWTRRIFLGSCAWFPLILVVGIGAILLLDLEGKQQWRPPCVMAIVLSIPLMVIVWKFDRGWKGWIHKEMGLLAVGLGTYFLLNVLVANPIDNAREQTRPFVESVETLNANSPGQVVFFRVGPDADAIKFMANRTEPIEPQFVQSLDSFWETKDRYYVITKEEVFQSLPAIEAARIKPLVRGRIGHHDFVAFSFTRGEP